MFILRMKKLIPVCLIILFSITSKGQVYPNAMVYYNDLDSLYYLDSSYTEKADGIMGYIPEVHYDDGFYKVLDSVSLELDNGILLSKTAFNNDYKFQVYKFLYKDNRVVDGVYDYVRRFYKSDGKGGYLDEYVEKITRSTYQNGKKNGLFYQFNSDNPHRIYQLGSYNNGYLDGLIIEFKVNGFPYSETMYTNGYINGFERTYFPDTNILKYEAYYKKGIAHGKLKTWWKNGNLRADVEYKNDSPNGETRIYQENGDLAVVQIVENGFAIKTEQYIEDISRLKKLQLVFPFKDSKQDVIKK